MKALQESDCMGAEFGSVTHNSSQRILYMLKTDNRGVRQTIQQSVAIVQLGVDKSIGQDNSRVSIERMANLSQLANVIKRGTADGGYVTSKIELRIEDDSKVACRISGSYWDILKENGRISDFGSIYGTKVEQ